ncbi:Nodule Cysteine-Rich (NCR) secreted peptide [Medicago truncatula]|uniref:Nodule Cysteine-Rich (NCR) secreted peptide n=1 Tax=Medicago truncatula TaxID=3880 RepID=A0A072VK32_MEDTR|nr:Nodule Cysteine-Rich (NCR) secreted peptide [Medicago truncatula]
MLLTYSFILFYITAFSFPCKTNSDCPSYLCHYPKNPECVERECICW